MANLLRELKKIHHQPTVAATVLMSIRARIEFKYGLDNRIGKVFSDGSRGVLLVGKAGTAKTRCLRAIYDGLGLETVNSEGRQVGKWISSAGASTSVGIYEVLQIYNDSIIFLDEMSLDTPNHVQILKQICNGHIVRPRHDNIEPIDFSGMLVCATNAIRLPRTNNLEHLLATLDRFYVVKARPPKIQPEEYMDNILGEGPKEEKIDWAAIKQAMLRKDAPDLNEKEKALLKHLWQKKTQEILDPTRAQWRNCWTAHDCFLFVKRFLGVKDMCEHKKVMKFAARMVNDSIIFNPVSVLWLKPLEEVIYNKVSSKDEVSLQEIITECDQAGLAVSVRYIHDVLNRMIQSRVICRSRHGSYSTKRIKDTGQQAEAVKKADAFANIL
jgi:hypothetical protein